MTDTEITEAYFVARGWTTGPYKNIAYIWRDQNGEPHDELPNILNSYPNFKQHVLGVMGEAGYKFEVTARGDKETREWSSAEWNKYEKFQGFVNDNYEEIKDNNILHAATIRATRYFEEKK